MKIIINGEEKEVKISFRADFIYENVMGKTFEGQYVSNWIVYFWASYLGANKDDAEALSLDEFTTWCDDNRDKLTEFVLYYTESISKTMKLRPKQEEKN